MSKLLPLRSFIFADSAALSTLSKAVEFRLQGALLPRTSRVYQAGFHLFVSFMVKMNLMLPHTEETVLLYLEFLAQNGLESMFFEESFINIKSLFFII